MLQRIFESWELSSHLNEWRNAPATEEALAEAEQSLGRRLPDELRAAYRFGDGFSLLSGNLRFYSLLHESFGLLNAGQQLRKWGAPVPEEAVIFGNDGSDSLFGLWLPKGSGGGKQAPVIQVIECSCLAIAGTSFVRFLACRTAYYLLLYAAKGTEAALDALGLPHELRTDYPDDETFEAIRAWGDPGILELTPGTWRRNVSPRELQQRYGTDRKG